MSLLYAVSSVPDGTANSFPAIHVSAATRRVAGLGIKASLGADTYWDLIFRIPAILPSGTLKLLLGSIANATSGNAKVNAKWARGAATYDYDAATLNAEGVSTVTWAAGNNDDILETKVVLDAVTAAASDWLYMRLTFETSGWTLAQRSVWIPMLIWE